MRKFKKGIKALFSILLIMSIVINQKTPLLSASELKHNNNIGRISTVSGGAIKVEDDHGIESMVNSPSLVQPMSGHTHTSSCYNGDMHAHSGSSSSGTGCYTYWWSHSHTTYCYSTQSCGKTHSVSTVTINYTTGCGGSGCTSKDKESIASYKVSCSSCGTLLNGNVAWRSCTCGSYTSNSLSSSLTYCTRSIQSLICNLGNGYWTTGCGKTSGNYYNGSTNVSATCSNVVKSIVAVNNPQTIFKGGSINLAVTATMLNDTTKIITSGVTSNLNNQTVGTQNVTLTYTGIVGTAKTTNGKVTTPISVIVKAGLTGLTVVPSSTTVYNGSEPTYTITATYGDGSKKTIPASSCAKTGWTTGYGTKTVKFTYTDNGESQSATCIITVKANPSSLEVTPNKVTMYNGDSKPTYSVVITYENGTKAQVTSFTESGWSTGAGTKAVTISYTEGNRTVSKGITITVKPNITSIIVNANKLSVLWNEDIIFITTANYEDGTSKIVTSHVLTGYDKTKIGNQVVSYSYTENNITKTGSASVAVLDYPVKLLVTLSNHQIFQTQRVKYNSIINLASGATTVDTGLTESEYDHMIVGNKNITYSYSLNGHTVIDTKTIDVLADLKGITVNKKEFDIYKGHDLGLVVEADFNIGGKKQVAGEQINIEGFQPTKYDREGKEYIVKFSDKGVTKTEIIFIKVKPDVSEIGIKSPVELTEGDRIGNRIEIDIVYEDGYEKKITGDNVNVIISGYNPEKVGNQDITITYKEGDVTISKIVTVRIRAQIRVSIPAKILMDYNPNNSTFLASNIEIINNSKEDVLISVNKISSSKLNDLIDVLPTEYEKWGQALGVTASNKIAIGIKPIGNWLSIMRKEPLYVAEANTRIDIGTIKKESKNSLEMVSESGNSFRNNKGLSYEIEWNIQLADD